MQQWMAEEWKVVNAGMTSAQQDENVVYQIQNRRQFLLRLCIKWEPMVRIIPDDAKVEWGPTSQEKEEAQKYEFTTQAGIASRHFNRTEESDEQVSEIEIQDNGEGSDESDGDVSESGSDSDGSENDGKESENSGNEDAEYWDNLESSALMDGFRSYL